jgi:hypothetical protein
MDSNPGTPLLFVVCVLAGLIALVVGVAFGMGMALELAKEGSQTARNVIISAAIVQWAKALIGMGLLMLGFFRDQQPAVRGGAFIAAGVLLASVTL